MLSLIITNMTIITLVHSGKRRCGETWCCTQRRGRQALPSADRRSEALPDNQRSDSPGCNYENDHFGDCGTERVACTQCQLWPQKDWSSWQQVWTGSKSSKRQERKDYYGTRSWSRDEGLVYISGSSSLEMTCYISELWEWHSQNVERKNCIFVDLDDESDILIFRNALVNKKIGDKLDLRKPCEFVFPSIVGWNTHWLMTPTVH